MAKKKIVVTDEERRQPLTPDLIARRLKLIGMMPMNLRAATGVPESTYLRWGQKRLYPSWLYSWLLLAEAAPDTARRLGFDVKQRPRGPMPRGVSQKLANWKATRAAEVRARGLVDKPNE